MDDRKKQLYESPFDDDEEVTETQESDTPIPGGTKKVNADLLEQALIDARNAARKRDATQPDVTEAPDVDESATIVEERPPSHETIVDRIQEADFYLEQELITDAKGVLKDVV